MFLFKKKKGNAGAGGGSFFLVLLALFILWPNIFPDKEINKEDIKEAATKIESVGKDSIEKIKNLNLPQYNLIKKENEESSYDKKEIKKLLSKIKIEEANFDIDGNGEPDYDRDVWEKPVKKFKGPISGESLNIKNYVLEVLTNKPYNSENLEFICPYYGEVITDRKKIDFDHIVPLAYVYGHGGGEWSDSQKNEYAFNPSNGICTGASANRAKGAKGPSQWMPKENKEWYCYEWLRICSEYNISLSQSDYDEIYKILVK